MGSRVDHLLFDVVRREDKRSKRSCQHKRLNNRAENSHLPTRKRERVLQRFKSGEHAQRFLGPFSAVSNHFRRVDTSSPLPPTDRSAPGHTPPGRTPLRLAFDSETGHPGGLARQGYLHWRSLRMARRNVNENSTAQTLAGAG